MKKKYLLIETSVFTDLFDNILVNFDKSCIVLRELLNILEGDSVMLLVPEVVRIEVEQNLHEKEAECAIANRGAIDNLAILDEGVRKGIKKTVDEHGRFKSFQEIRKLLGGIFSHRNTQMIILTPEIYLEAYKRVIRKEKPTKKTFYDRRFLYDVQPDCLIVESVRDYLESRKDYELYLCCKDADFIDEGGGETGVAEIHPCIKRDFEHIELFKSLPALLNKIFGKEIPSDRIEAKVNKEQDLGIERRKEQFPGVDMGLLIEELERSISFKIARGNMQNILEYKKQLTNDYVKKILKAMVSNPENYKLNQVLEVDAEVGFTKDLFVLFRHLREDWMDFADNITLYFDENLNRLQFYNWLFKRLGMKEYHPETKEIPF